jgi:hypothetical protein
MRKVIEDFPKYEIDDAGNVFNKKSNKQIKEKLNNKHYSIVNLWIDGYHAKQRLVHRLVAKAFIPNPDNKSEVNHIDGNKQNNSVNNLEWVTRKENVYHSIKHGLAPQCSIGYEKRGYKVSQFTLDGTFVKTWRSLREIESVLGYAHGNISNCCNGKYKQAYGYHWKYKGVEANRDECSDVK